MITILSSPTIDLEGSVMIDALPTSEYGETRRRAFRIPTTDGGAVVNDFGFSYSDRNLRILWKTGDKAYEEKIDRLCRTYPRLNFACHLGIFSVVPNGYLIANGESELSLLVMEKL